MTICWYLKISKSENALKQAAKIIKFIKKYSPKVFRRCNELKDSKLPSLLRIKKNHFLFMFVYFISEQKKNTFWKAQKSFVISYLTMIDSDFIVGTCEAMCPLAEIVLRKNNKLVHIFEKDEFYITEFSRSAADRPRPKKSDLRTFEAMQKTLEYMFNK